MGLAVNRQNASTAHDAVAPASAANRPIKERNSLLRYGAALVLIAMLFGAVFLFIGHDDMPPPRHFDTTDKWTIGEPDLILRSKDVTVPAIGPDRWGRVLIERASRRTRNRPGSAALRRGTGLPSRRCGAPLQGGTRGRG